MIISNGQRRCVRCGNVKINYYFFLEYNNNFFLDPCKNESHRRSLWLIKIQTPYLSSFIYELFLKYVCMYCYRYTYLYQRRIDLKSTFCPISDDMIQERNVGSFAFTTIYSPLQRIGGKCLLPQNVDDLDSCAGSTAIPDFLKTCFDGWFKLKSRLICNIEIKFVSETSLGLKLGNTQCDNVETFSFSWIAHMSKTFRSTRITNPKYLVVTTDCYLVVFTLATCQSVQSVKQFKKII